MNVSQSAAQHLASQGVTFEGRSLIFKRPQELDAGVALERAQKGRPVDAMIEGRRFSIEKPTDLVELDFFKTQGQGQGLKDVDLARSLRDLKFTQLVVSKPNGGCLPMQAYRILSGQQEGQVFASHPKHRNAGQVQRDDVLALGFFAGNIGEAANLAHPGRAQSLLELQEAGMLYSPSSPAEIYIAHPDRIALAIPQAAAYVQVAAERLEQPQEVAETLARLDRVDELRQQYLPEAASLPSQLQKTAWAGNLEMEPCEQLFQHFASAPKELPRLLRLLDGDQLPGAELVAQYEELRRRLPEAPIQSQEFQWLTSDADKFEERLQLLEESKKLSAHDADWHEHIPSAVIRLEENPQRRPLYRQLDAIHPLYYNSFVLAGSLPDEDCQRFTEVYRMAAPEGLTEKPQFRELRALWADAGAGFLGNHENLLQRGADGGQALIGSAALGENPSSQMLDLAARLVNPKDSGYTHNPYALALKFAAGLKPEKLKTFADVFGGRKLTDWEYTWAQIQDPGCLELLQGVREAGLPDYQLSVMRQSGASAETLLKNLKETPDERALRGQRWVAYTARQLSGSQASAAGFSLSRHQSRENQKAELSEVNHWYVPTRDYVGTLENQRRNNAADAAYGQQLSQAARAWDQRLAELQRGQIPWGEPPR